jgi:hypothetical protein
MNARSLAVLTAALALAFADSRAWFLARTAAERKFAAPPPTPE